MRALKIGIAIVGLAGCASEAGRIDRTGFDLQACPTGAMSPFEGLSPGEPVDYLELRTSDGGAVSTGDRCATATDPMACAQDYQALLPPADAWDPRPAGGAPPPSQYLVFTRGDEVATVGGYGLAPFLAPVDDAIDAAFLAQVATQGTVDCTMPSARVVPGGIEVITTRVQTCGGRIDELRVLIDGSGAATLVEMVKIRDGSGGVCP